VCSLPPSLQGSRKGGQKSRKKARQGTVINRWRRKSSKTLNAITHVDVFSQELVRGLVLLQSVVVDATAGKGAAEEETEESVFINPDQLQYQTQLRGGSI